MDSTGLQKNQRKCNIRICFIKIINIFIYKTYIESNNTKPLNKITCDESRLKMLTDALEGVTYGHKASKGVHLKEIAIVGKLRVAALPQAKNYDNISHNWR